MFGLLKVGKVKTFPPQHADQSMPLTVLRSHQLPSSMSFRKVVRRKSLLTYLRLTDFLVIVCCTVLFHCLRQSMFYYAKNGAPVEDQSLKLAPRQPWA